MNPVVIERCTKLPPNFPVTTDMVKGSLNRGKTLDKEMKVNNVLYSAEYSTSDTDSSYRGLTPIAKDYLQKYWSI